MGIQVVAEASTIAEVEKALGKIASECEVFAAGGGRFGVSVPTRLVDAVGEGAVRKALSRLRHFDLWEGKWNEPTKGWALCR